jgi:hypothetical protein
MDQQIGKSVIDGLKQLSVETAEKAAEETGKMFESIITGKELLGDIKPMDETELAKKQQEDERKKQEEINKLKSEMGQGRKVEEELKELREEKEREEKMEKRQEAEEKQREQEEYEMMNSYVEEPATKKRGPGSGMVKGKQGKASNSDMSATAEYYKKPD